MTNKNKLVLILALLIGLLASLSFNATASPGRIYGMGLPIDELAWMLSAEEGYFMDNPAILMQLAPQIWAELADLDAGLLLSPAKNVNLYLLTGINMALPAAFNAPAAANLDALSEELIRVGLGFALNNFDLGFSVGMGTTSASNDTAGAAEDHLNLVINFNGGLALNLSKQMSLDAAGGGTFWNLKREYENPLNNDYNATDFDFYALGRLNWELIPKNIFHIYGKYNFLNRGYTLAGTDVDNTTSLIMLGFSDEIQLLDNVLILAGGYFGGDFNDAGGTDSHNLVVTGHAGAEIGFTDNFLGRVGIIKNFWSQEYNAGTEITSNDDNTTIITCGIGLLLGNFALDMHVEETLFLDGPDFITGSSIGTWSAQLSLTYYFDNVKGKKK